jgi:hypothetical protein
MEVDGVLDLLLAKANNPTAMTAALDEIIREARADAEAALKWGSADHNLHLAVGVFAVVAGGLAGLSGLAEFQGAFTAVAGFAAAILAGVQTLAQAEERSRFNYKNGADFKGLVLDGLILQDRDEPAPSQEELRDLAGRLTAIRGRVFGSESASVLGVPIPTRARRRAS